MLPPLVQRTQEYACEQPQDVHRGDRRAKDSEKPKHGIGLESPDKYEELSDESAQAGKPQRSQACDAEEHRGHSHSTCQPSKACDLPRVGTVVDYADKREEQRGHDSVREHL